MSEDRELVELELHTPDEHKVFRLERIQNELVTTSGVAGEKLRISKKKYDDAHQANEALRAALNKRYKAGYFPLSKQLPPPVELEPPEALGEGLCFVPVPKKGNDLPPLRDALPPQLEQHKKKHGYHYADGPAGSSLWFGTCLSVGVRHFIREVTPKLAGNRFQFFPRNQIPFHPKANAVMLGHGETIYEIDIETARATELYRFDDPKTLERTHQICYTGDGEAILWWEGPTLFLKPKNAERRVVFELLGESVLGMVRLSTGEFAVLQQSTLTVLALDGSQVSPSHSIQCNDARSIGTWLEGRVLVVSSPQERPRSSVFFAVDEGGLHEMCTSKHAILHAFDARGAQWMHTSAGISWGVSAGYQVLGVGAAWEAACKTPPVLANHIIEATPLRTAVITALEVPLEEGLAYVRAMHARGWGIDTREGNKGWTALIQATWRGSQPFVALLLELGADINAVDNEGQSPLTVALQHGQVDTATQLLDAGAAVTVPHEAEIEGRRVRLESPLVAAARTGQRAHLLRMIEAGASVDDVGSDGATALYAAMQNRHIELAELLLERGASVNALVEGAPAPLSAAVASGNASLVRAIASRTSDIRGPVGAQALMNACSNLAVNSIAREVVDLLVEYGATTNAVNTLQYAVLARHGGAVKAMLAGGADPNAPYKTANKPSLPLQVAHLVSDPDTEVVAALLEGGADINALDDRGLPALNYAIANGASTAHIRRLVNAGANLSAIGNAWGGLHQAAWSGRIDVLDLLLDAGAPIDGLTTSGQAALTMAAGNGQREALRHLLGRGADPNAGTWTALMAAAVKNDTESVELLLTAGADATGKAANPSSKDTTERTAQEHAEAAHAEATSALLGAHVGGGPATLHAAVEADNLAAVREMLDGGADPNATSGDARVPVLHVVRSAAAVELLVDRGATIDAVDARGHGVLVALASQTDDAALACVEALLAHGADPKQNGAGPLHAAVTAGGVAMAERLIEAGCPVESDKGEQPLHVAASSGNVEMARLLLDNGASVQPVTHNVNGGEETPLHRAAEENLVEMAELLIDRGADVGALADDGLGDEEDEAYWSEGGYTPLHRAAEAGNFEVLVTLLRHDTGGARHERTVSGQALTDLAEDEPRCLALLEALEETDDLDAALESVSEMED